MSSPSVLRALAAAVLVLAMAGCGGDLAITFPTPTTSIAPAPESPSPVETGTPFVPPTPTPEASETPFPFPSRLPPTIPVYGAISVAIRDLDGRPSLHGPSTIAMTWSVHGIDEEVRLIPQNPRSGDFRMVLPPGETYELTGFEVNDPSFGFGSAELVPYGPNGGGPAFVVPSAGCLYVGRLSFAFTQLPRADTLAQLEIAQELAAGQSLAIFFTDAGSFVYLPDDPAAHRFRIPAAGKRPPEARGCRAASPTFAS